MDLYEFERRKNVALYNEKLIRIGRIERKYPQSDIEKWAEKKLKNGNQMYRKQINYNNRIRNKYKNKYGVNSNIPPPPYTSVSNNSNPPSYDELYGKPLPTIPPPPYESYDDYMKRKNRNKSKN